MEKSKTIRGISPFFAALLIAVPAQGGEFRVRTDLGATSFVAGASSMEHSLGFEKTEQSTASARLMWDGQLSGASASVHLNISGAHGSAVALANALAVPAGPPSTQFDLRVDVDAGTDTQVVGVLDRAFVTFSTDQAVLTIGRQAITWGGGLMFQPMDVVAPFPPDAIDTTYKPGVDMVYGQYLFDNGADIQALFVPRASRFGAKPDVKHSSLAVLGSASLGPLDARLLAGKDRGKSVFGIGLGGPLSGAAWNVEWVGLETDAGDHAPFWVANISHFSSLGDWNLSYFAEYYHNPLGVSAQTPLDGLPDELADRMAFGQIFLPGRDFVGLGGSMQVSPDVTISPSAIISLEDGSYLARMSVASSLSDNTDVFLDVAVPTGPDGSEFGGRETSEGSGIFAAPPMSASLRYVKHF